MDESLNTAVDQHRTDELQRVIDNFGAEVTMTSDDGKTSVYFAKGEEFPEEWRKEVLDFRPLSRKQRRLIKKHLRLK